MADSVLGNVIAFMARIGVYDVVLPFLLVFTIMFAILERSLVFGKEKYGDYEGSKKNLNAMASFVIAFLVVASSQLVAIITAISAKVVVLLVVLVFFLMLIGTFYGKDEEVKLEQGWRTLFMVIVFIGVAFIAFDSITVGGSSLLDQIWRFLTSFWSSAAVASVIFIVLLILFMVWLTKAETEKKEEKPDKGKGGK